MYWRGELNCAHERQTFARLEIELDRLDQMSQIDLNVDEYVQDLNATRNVNRDFKKKFTKIL